MYIIAIETAHIEHTLVNFGHFTDFERLSNGSREGLVLPIGGD